MGKEYKFSWEKCVCGQKLPDKHVELQSMIGGIPVGLCPKCGSAYPLVEIEPEPEPAPEPEPES